MTDRITAGLLRLYEDQGHRIVFWYDAARDLRGAFEAVEIPGVTKVEIANNEFGLKYRMLRQEPKTRFTVHLVTAPDDGSIQEQRECLDGISEACTGTGVEFTWAFDGTGTLHARDITTDHGWKMVLDRGLDIFQPTPRKLNGFSLGERMQEHRMVKGFYVTYVAQS